MAVRRAEVGRISQLMFQGATEWHAAHMGATITVSPSLFDSGSHGAVISGLGMFLGRGPSARIVGATWVSSFH